jgi:hypothetical protein
MKCRTCAPFYSESIIRRERRFLPGKCRARKKPYSLVDEMKGRRVQYVVKSNSFNRICPLNRSAFRTGAIRAMISKKDARYKAHVIYDTTRTRTRTYTENIFTRNQDSRRFLFPPRNVIQPTTLTLTATPTPGGGTSRSIQLTKPSQSAHYQSTVSSQSDFCRERDSVCR